MRITINLNRKEITDDILAKSNLLARQMARNPETEELAGDIMTPDDEQVKQVGIEWCVRQCRELMAHGVPSLHFYSVAAEDSIREVAKQIF